MTKFLSTLRPIVLLGILFISNNLIAQAPEKISYQAVVRNAEGELIANSQIGIEISIIQNSTAGPVAYKETQSPFSNENGLISLEIGNGTSIQGDFSTIDWAANNYFIKTRIDFNGGLNYSLEGTQQLLSVPYALYAKSSGSSTPGPAGEQGNGIKATIDNGDGSFTLIFDNEETFTTSNLTGPKGADGKDGSSITQVSDNGDGTLTLTYGNGQTMTTSNLVGPKGDQGLQGATGMIGNGIGSTVDNGDGTFTLMYTDGTSFTTIDLTGRNGENGKDGQDGNSINTITDNGNGTLTFNFTNDTNYTTPDLRGSKGDQGETGVDGIGIETTVDNNDGTFTLNFTDGSSFTTADFTGPVGENGNGIKSTIDNGDGSFTLIFDDEQTFTSSNLTGPKGDQGAQGATGLMGNGISSTVDNNDGTFTLIYADGTSFTTINLTGPTGENGQDGQDGNSITNITNNENGTLTFHFTNDTTYTTPDLRGPKGDQGETGIDGTGIETAINNNDGTFTLNFTDGSSFTTADFTGPEGSFQAGSQKGQMLYWDGQTWLLVAPGSQGQNLTLCDNVPTWGPCPTLAIITMDNITVNSDILAVAEASFSGNNVVTTGFCWSTDPNPTINDQKTEDTPPSESFTSNITGLSAGTLYYIKAYAINDAGIAYSEGSSFETLDLPIVRLSINTYNHSSFFPIISLLSPQITTSGVCLSTSPNPTIENSRVEYMPASSPRLIQGLYSNTQYFVRAFAINAVGISYSNEESFITRPVAEFSTVNIDGATANGKNSASLSAEAIDAGNDYISKRGFVLNTTGNPDVNDISILSGSGLGVFTANPSNLTPNTTYYVKAFAENSRGQAYSSELSFTTDPEVVLPTVSLLAASKNGPTVATLSGTVDNDGNASVTARGFVLNTTGNPNTDDIKITNGPGTGYFMANPLNLTSNTTYYVKAYAINSAGTAYSNQLTFRTDRREPTLSILDINLYTATYILYNLDNVPISSNGLCWSTSQNPTPDDSKVEFSGGISPDYGVSISGLQPGNTYYFRAYAIKTNGDIVYSSQVSRTKPAVSPTVTLGSYNATGETTLSGSSTVTNSGGASVTARGIVYSTSPSPTISNQKTVNGSGTGSFSSSVSGLQPNTSYYIRAYATNSSGTGYSAQTAVTTEQSISLGSIILTSATASENSINGSGDLTDDGGGTILEKGVCLSTSPGPTVNNLKVTYSNTLGRFLFTFGSVSSNATYYLRAYVRNEAGIAYSNEISVRVNSTPTSTIATLSNTRISTELQGAVILNSSVLGDGGSTVTERGFVYSTSNNPTTGNIRLLAGAGTGAFSAVLSIIPRSAIYIRSYAINSQGTAYGTETIYIPEGPVQMKTK